MRLPSPSETDRQQRPTEALWRLFPSRMENQQGRGQRSGHSQRNGLTAASILAEDSLNLQKKPTKGDSSHLNEEYPYGEDDIFSGKKGYIRENVCTFPLFLASMRLPSPSETDRQRPRKKPSGASYLHGWRISRAESREAATANGTASQRPLSLRRIASTYRRSHEGRQITPLRMGNQQPKIFPLKYFGKKGYTFGKKGYTFGKKG